MTPFRFKYFEVRHEHSSMRVGVDSITLGCWMDVSQCRRILDVGTGCGILALMCAQRNPEAEIDAIDIDEASVSEASANFKSSPWSHRLTALQADFMTDPDSETYIYNKERKYDLIISNPPYFDSGVTDPATPREKARHQQEFSPLSLITRGVDMLTDTGRIAMIIPRDRRDEVIECARQSGMMEARAAEVYGHKDAVCKRMLLELKKVTPNVCADNILMQKIVIEKERNVPTDEFKSLCRDFYLNF